MPSTTWNSLFYKIHLPVLSDRRVVEKPRYCESFWGSIQAFRAPSTNLMTSAWRQCFRNHACCRGERQLSLGLARRAALARAFVVQPQLLILDEPFVSLDDATAIRLRQLLLSLWQQRQTTALMVTHNIREAAILADRILVFSKRPAKVLGELEIDIAQGHRDDEFLDDVVNKVSNIVSG